MFEMPRRGHQAGQPFRRGDPLTRVGRGFHRVDIVVVGAGMLRVLRQRLLQYRHDLFRPGCRRAIQ